MSGYKEKLELLKATLGLVEKAEAEPKKEEVKLADEQPETKEAPKEEAPKVEYVTMAQFDELKAKQEEFMTSVTDMLTSAMEMLNPTEQHKVPQEMKKQEELAAQPLVHDPESQSNKPAKLTRIGKGMTGTIGDNVFNQLFGESADLSIYETK